MVTKLGLLPSHGFVKGIDRIGHAFHLHFFSCFWIKEARSTPPALDDLDRELDRVVTVDRGQGREAFVLFVPLVSFRTLAAGRFPRPTLGERVLE